MGTSDVREFLDHISEPVQLTDAPATPQKFRSLTEAEVDRLIHRGNICDDWSQIRVSPDFTTEKITGNTFEGSVHLGSCNQSGSMITGSRIADSIIGDNVTIRDVRFLRGYVVGDIATLCDLGALICDGESTFGNGIELPVAIESGGREVRIFSEMTLSLARQLALAGGDPDVLPEYRGFLEDYVSKLTSGRGVVCAHASLRHTGKIRNSWIGPYAIVDNATLVENATILSGKEEPSTVSDGAYLRDSIMQWGCEVTSMAIVENSLLTEHSHVERHGKVLESIIGPNSGVAEGEVTASLVGPFVGFHHQALLIAALWPEGRGNIGYGANVGSNHTSRAPDQEIWPGEGVFFGLGSSIKYPANYSQAPYSIIATGVTTLPQRVTMPFSLINLPLRLNPDYPRGYNEIFPGWVLAENIYMIKRNEAKYRRRNKARRTTFEFEVFRPSIVELMITARDTLSVVENTADFYTDREIEGLGKNILREKSRLAGIDSYTVFIEYYALCGVQRELRRMENLSDPETFLRTESDRDRWEHERRILHTEPELAGKSARELLELLIEKEKTIADNVLNARRKDDRRGSRIIDDYEDVHTLGEEDAFVQETFKELERKKKQIEQLLARL